MRIVDAHVHLYPPEINRAPAEWAAAHNEPHWALLCTRIRKNGKPVQSFPDLANLLRAMDAGGIERVVLQGWYWEKHDTCVRQNRFYAGCLKAHPDRISAFATLHPAAGVSVIRDELRRAAGEGFCGVGELSPHSQGVAIDHPVLCEAFALAGELRLPVNLHVTEPAGKNYPGRVATPLEDFLRLAGEFPQTMFILAHWGARLPLHPTLGDAARRCENLFYDTAASPLNYDAQVYREMIDAVGAERLLYGSDHPLNLFPQRDQAAQLSAMLDEIRGAGLTVAEQSALLGGSVRGVLRLA